VIRLSSGARSVKMACRMVFSRPNDTTYRVALIEISRMGNDDAQLADESSCVEPYAAIYREHFE
jgi:hypothetical protein